MNTVEDVCKYIGSVISDAPVCIETGCTWTMPPENEIHTTTNNLYKYVVVPNDGHLFSLDIDKTHIEFATSILCSIPVEVHSFNFMHGDSVDSMRSLRSILGEASVDLVCLDALGDPEHTAQEYVEIKSCLKEKHFVLVDDIHNPNSIKYKTIVPMLKELGYKYKEIFTPTGLFLSCVGYDI